MKRLKPYISTRTILITVAALIAFHLVFLAIYTQRHKVTQYLAARDAAIQKVMDIVHVVKATEAERLQYAIDEMNMPLANVQLSDEPAWSLHAKDLTFWTINHYTYRVGNG